ncbi:hypothetical protein C8J56DRAFT_798988, partial [Mycena floridula]
LISKLAFCRSLFARRGLIVKGSFNLASNVAFNKFCYDSHIGNIISYGTVLKDLYGLSA